MGAFLSECLYFLLPSIDKKITSLSLYLCILYGKTEGTAGGSCNQSFTTRNFDLVHLILLGNLKEKSC